MILIKILIAILVLAFLFCLIMLAKNENTFRNHQKLIDAIYYANIDSLENHRLENHISFNSIEGYDKSFWRLWDWSYKRCVSPDVLKKLEPYIQKGR